jgi:hypothetical protein
MATSFAADILPKFRPGDIACMAPKGIHIGSAEWMCDPAASNGLSGSRQCAACSFGARARNHAAQPQVAARVDRQLRVLDDRRFQPVNNQRSPR